VNVAKISCTVCHWEIWLKLHCYSSYSHSSWGRNARSLCWRNVQSWCLAIRARTHQQIIFFCKNLFARCKYTSVPDNTKIVPGQPISCRTLAVREGHGATSSCDGRYSSEKMAQKKKHCIRRVWDQMRMCLGRLCRYYQQIRVEFNPVQSHSRVTGCAHRPSRVQSSPR
jgi:hypothetical protein